MKKIVMVFADGFEMVEALSVVDILKRGGVNIVMCSITDKLLLTSAHNVKIEMDCYLKDVDINTVDGIILPGGMPGTTHLAADELLGEWILNLNAEKKLVAAICAAPTVLGKYGILADKQATCYPTFESKLNARELISNQMVVRDDNVITSRGMGTSFEFGFAILAALTDADTVEKVKESVIYMYEA